MKKILLSLLVIMLLVLVGCQNDKKTETEPTDTEKNPSITVDDMVLDEGDSVEIVVNFIDMIEESVEYTVNDSAIAEISGGYLEALSAGETTVDVVSESGLTCVFKVTVNAVAKLSAIEEFNAMGAFESSLNQLGWVVSNENVASSYAGDYRSGLYSLRLYGGWDDVNSVSLDFNVSLTANIGGLKEETHTISYYLWEMGTIEISFEINGETLWPTWYKKDGDFNRYVVEFVPKADANVITMHVNATAQPWASLDDLTLIEGVVNEPEITFNPVTLKLGESIALADLVYTTIPVDLPLTELEYLTSDNIEINENNLVGLSVGEGILTVSGKVNGVDFLEEVAVNVVDLLVNTLKAINEFNVIGSFDDETKTFTTTTTNAGSILLETGTTNYRYEIDNQAETTYTVTLETTVSGLEAGEYSLSLIACAWFHRADIKISINDEVIGTYDKYANTWSTEASSESETLVYDFTVAEGVENVKVTITFNIYTWAWCAVDNINIISK